MTQKTKRKKKSKKLWILLVLLIFGVITVIGLYQSQQQSANVHFEIVSAGWDGYPPELKSNDTVATYAIYGVAVTFKAVGGDAHQVVVESWVGSEAEGLGTMLKDTPRTVLLYASTGYLTRKEENGYPVSIRISSLETGTKKLTFYITI